jgi:hypothetical protein
MTGRERIVVSASDTLERVLERVRSSAAAELVLDVDERSALLLNLQHLHSLDEAAQDQGVQLTIASTNSKLLNAARVFGLAVIDTRGAPPVAAPAPAGRLLAGQPLGHLDLEESDEEEVVAAPPPTPVTPPAPVKPASPARPTVQLRPAAKPIRPVPKPSQARHSEPRQEQDEATDDEEGWDEPPTPVARTRQQPTAPPAVAPPAAPPPAASPPAAPPIQQRAASLRLDPYGQPYAEETADESTDEPAPSRATRTIRALRSGANHRPTTGPDNSVEDGWDDEAGAYADDEYADEYADEPQRRPGILDGIAAFWADVRAWIDARRGVGTIEEYEEDEQVEIGEPADDDGWDEPPYRARHAGQQVDVTTASAQAEEEELAEDEEPPTPMRPMRPTAVGRGPATMVEDAPAAQLRPFVASVTTFDDDDEDFDQALAGTGWRPGRATRGGARFAIGSLVGIVIAVVLVALLALYIVLPTATVTLVARTGTVTADFNVVVGEIDPNSPQGQPTQERIVVPAKRITVPLKATSSKPATGARLEPDVTAGGPVVLNNSASSAVTVAKGTTLTADDGRTYVTLEGVTIGPADRFAGVFGSATVTVAAGIKGSGGNAAIGAVKGQLGNDVTFINKTAPIAGGSDKRIQQIAKQDLDAAQAAAEAAVRGQGQGALNGAIPAGSTIMHDTAGVGNLKATFSAQAGADGDSVTATVTAEATALVYTQGDVEAQGRAEAERRLNATVKPGEPIVAGSMQINPPQVVGDVPGQLTYKVTGSARTRAAIGSDAQRAQLAKDLANTSDDEVHATIAGIPGVSSSTIDYATGPFPRRMPWLSSHITIRIADGQ